MDHTLIINNKRILFESQTPSDGRMQVTAAGAGHQVAYCMVSDHHLLLQVDQTTVNAHLIDDGDQTLVTIDGQLYHVSEFDEAQDAVAGISGAVHVPPEVTPPMPAVVVRVMAQNGDVVAKGQPLVVVSAMKMETTLVAPFAGCVAKVNVAPGDKVMPGDVLVDLTPDSEAHGAAAASGVM